MKDLFFPEDYFKGEEREGFFVEEMMKRAWAAQLVCLQEVDAVCKKHNIQWFAEYGTLLGAIRHKGFIPWDDDLDIGMLRPDYEKFIRTAYRDLPKGYAILNVYNTPEWDNYMTRIVNHTDINNRPETMEKYHGCPFPVGVDVFVVDYLPRDAEELDLYKTLIEMASTAANIYESEEETPEAKKEMVSRIEKVMKTKIHRGRPIPQQLRELADHICGMYGPKDADYIGSAVRQVVWENYFVKKECYESITELPFEMTTIQVPAGYEDVVKMRFGDNYMEPIRHNKHNYPFYKDMLAKYEAAYQEKLNG